MQIGSHEQEIPHSVLSHALKFAGCFVPAALPWRPHQCWETPHLGSSAKACQINKELPALSAPKLQGGPMRMWSPSLQHAACFQQQGQMCTLNGHSSWELCCGNGGSASTGAVSVLGAPHDITAMCRYSRSRNALWRPLPLPAAQMWGKTVMTQPYRGTYQQTYQFLISLSALLHMPCEIQSSASKGSLPLKDCMLPACKHCSDLIKLDFIISVVKPVWFLWANTAGVSTSTCIWTDINTVHKRVTFGFPYHSHFPCFSCILLPIFMHYFICSH